MHTYIKLTVHNFNLCSLLQGHGEDVGLICAEQRIYQVAYTWSDSLLHFTGETGKSSLENVKLSVLQYQRARNSSEPKLSRRWGILCDGSGCPYVKNLHINGFFVAIGIRNYSAGIFLHNINIRNCSYGVVAQTSVEGNRSVSRLSNMIRLKNISITNCHVGVMFTEHSTLPIELMEMTITNCYYGVFVSKNMFTKVKMSDLTLDSGINGIILQTKPGDFGTVNLCDNSYQYNKSYPVEITSALYNTFCSMVSISNTFSPSLMFYP